MKSKPFIISANNIERNPDKNIAIPLFVNGIIDKLGLYDELRIHTTEKHNSTARIIISKIEETGLIDSKHTKIREAISYNDKCKICGKEMIYETDEDDILIDGSARCSSNECDNTEIEKLKVIEYLITKIPACKRF